MKVACTVWSGGKPGDSIKWLPIAINAASNAFKRASYGLIDYFLEEETELRNKAIITGLDPTVLETRLDDMWGKVTLYNCYQLFVQLTSKKLKNPAKYKDPSLNADLLGIDANEYIGVVNDIEGNGDVDLINARLDGNDYVLSHDKSHGQDLGEAHTELMKYLDENLWEGADDKDMLTLYFNAVKCLPRNSIRTLVGDADNALKSMAGAEKMLASVYGIAITGMAFFTDPTISTLTSGRPSQNVDLATLAFPRALGVRFDKDYVAKHSLVGKQAVWSAYEDFEFTKKYEGDDFSHENLINETGWAKFYFKGIFPSDVTYLRCEIIDVVTRQVIEVFHYKFTKGYQRNFAGDKLVKDPVLREKVVLNGVMEEITYDTKVSEVRINHPDNNYKAEDEALRKAGKIPRLYNMYEPDDVGTMSILRPGVVRSIKLVKRKIKDKSATGESKTVVKYFEEVTTYSYGRSSFKSKRIITNSDNESEIKDYDAPITTQTDVRYCEKPKMIFLVTPPHLMAYAKLILILLKQLVELNFDQSYLTKSSQKPLYRTCYMIDELGNLQSEGNGISNLETYLSIGLGQEQQFRATCCIMKSYAMLMRLFSYA